MLFYRLTTGLNDKGQLVPENQDPYDLVNLDQDCYISIYKYNEKQKEQFYETVINPKTNKEDRRGCAGITDVVTNKLVFDFDSKNIGVAQKSTIDLCERLMQKGVEEEALQIAFSGNKGFSVEIELTETLTPKEARHIAENLAADLEGFDTTVYNASRIFRMLLSKHQKSGLYKIPLTYEDLLSTPSREIKELAKSNDYDLNDLRSYWKKTDVPLKEVVLPQKEVDPPTKEVVQLDYSEKPRFLDNARWAMQNGHFNEGDRSMVLLCLAATYKNLGYKESHVYRMLKGVAELQSANTGDERFPDNEIYNNIVLQVFGPNWKGGQFTTRDPDNWLYKWAIKNNIPMEKDDSTGVSKIADISGQFTDFVNNIEKNRIYTGIKELDEKLFICTGVNLGVVAAAGAGKTALALNILNNTSRQGVPSVFASLDMSKTRMYEKVLYKISGLSRDEIYEAHKQGRGEEFAEKIKEEFEHVYFFGKSAATVQDIRDYILGIEEETGEKIKLVMVDYFERLNCDFQDDTAASKRMANELQDMVNDLGICLITLFQPTKASLAAGPDSPIMSYTAIKGSSFIYQSNRIILSLWRPFYNPTWKNHDKYMQMATLKNDFGELHTFDFAWKGKTGEIRSLEDHERNLLRDTLNKRDMNTTEVKGKNKYEGW